MRIILKYIVTNIKEHKARTGVMLLSIILSTVLLFVSFSIAESYESAQEKMAKGMAGSATIVVQAKEGNIRKSDISDLPEIQAKVGIVNAEALYKEKGYYETIDLIGAELDSLNQINQPVLHHNEELNQLLDRQIVLPDRFTDKFGISKGDNIDLFIGEKKVTLQVAAIANYDTVFLRHTRGANGLLELEALNHLIGSEACSKVLIKPIKGVSTDQLIRKLKKQLPEEKYQVTSVVNEVQLHSDARQKSMPFFLISFFSLTMSVFIIYSSYKVITLDRLPVIGTFRSIGATQKMVTSILILESLIYGCLGGGIGIPVGIVALKMILQGMGNSLSQGMKIPVVISVVGMIASCMTAILVSLLSAWIPAYKASHLPIKDVIFGTVEEKNIPKPMIVFIGDVTFTLSAILPKVVKGKMLYIAGGLSLLGLMIAIILLIPIIANMASKILEHFYGKLFGNEGRLSARNMKDNKSVTQNLTLLFISISAIIVISVVSNFVTTYICDVFRGAKLQGFVDGEMDEAFIRQVSEMEGIEEVLPVYVMNRQIQGEGVTFSRFEGIEDLELYNEMLALRYSEEEMKMRAIEAFRNGQRAIILSEKCLSQVGLSVGQGISIGKEDTKNYTIVGSFKSRATDVEAVIPATFAREELGCKSYHFLAYTAKDPDAIMIQVRYLFGERTNWSRTIEEFNKDALSTVSTFLAPMHSMTYFILILAAIGVINNLLIQYMQKRHTIAMYKSVGLSNKQNAKMTLLESFTAGVLGAFCAILVSYMEIKTSNCSVVILSKNKIALIGQCFS